MKKYIYEFKLFLLAILTAFIWINKTINPIFGLIVYLLLFIWLYITKKPLINYILVVFFSIMAISIDLRAYKIDSILIIILFTYTIIKNFKYQYIVFGRLLLVLVINIIYCMISIFWVKVKVDGWVGVSALVEGYMMYYVITNNNIDTSKYDLINISKTATFIMLTLTFEIIYMYYKIGFKNILEIKDLLNLGWGFSNTIAVIYVFLFPLALFKYLKKREYYLIYFLLDFINLLGIILTLSRGAYLGFVIGLLLFILFNLSKEFIIKYGSVFILFTLIFSALFKKYLFILVDKITKNLLYDSHRYSLYKIAVRSFLNKPLFGNGLKSSKYLIQKYSDLSNTYFHNFILQIAATLGVVGLIILIMYFIQIFRILFKRNDKFVYAVTFGVIGELVHQMFDISFDIYFFGLYMYFLLAYVEVYRNNLLNDKYKLKRFDIKNT